jgi:DNA-binding response OmpR family regulator
MDPFKQEVLRLIAPSKKILSIGLGDLVTSRNLTLRSAGFEVLSATTLEDTGKACLSAKYDLAIIGCAFTNEERSALVRCVKGIFHLPVIIVADADCPRSLPADSYLQVDAPPESLLDAVRMLLGDKILTRRAG